MELSVSKNLGSLLQMEVRTTITLQLPWDSAVICAASDHCMGSVWMAHCSGNCAVHTQGGSEKDSCVSASSTQGVG